jgi:sirohydrochlorin ferrochelatase
MSDSPALLLIGHGSRSERGVAQFFELAELVRAAAPHLLVVSGLIEHARPSLDEAVTQAAESDAGAESGVVAVPLVLLPAGHLKDDGPAALARGRSRFPAVGFRYARHLGVHPLVLAAIEERCRAALLNLGERAGPATIVLVGRGSTDPDANSDLYKAARLLADRRSIGGDPVLDEVQPAFVSLARPSVPEALDRARRLGAERIAVVPYFLFTGILLDRIGREARSWAAGEGVPVALGEEIGPDGRLVELVLERFEEASGAVPPMNCDGCIYRLALPGYEERVGRPPSSS